MQIYSNYSLFGHNPFGIDAKCWQYVDVETAKEAAQKLPFVARSTRGHMVIGAGSNLLLTKDYDGIIIHSSIKGVTFSFADDGGNDVYVRAGSGECFDDVVAATIGLGYYGLENLSIIPGDVGASAVQNIGAYGVEAKDYIHSIEAVEITTGKVLRISKAECEYGYRQSRFKTDWKGRYLITHVTYKLSREFVPHLQYGGIVKALENAGFARLEGGDFEGLSAMDVRNVVMEIRNSKLPDPKELGNGGSFFMNPVVERRVFEALQEKYPLMPHYDVDARHVKIPTAWMIEQCGWKGRALGKAAVHDKQALVLVNLGGATGREILDLCNAVRQDVRERFCIDIHPEVNIV